MEDSNDPMIEDTPDEDNNIDELDEFDDEF